MSGERTRHVGSATATPAPARGAAPQITRHAAAVLALQRSAGNRATRALLRNPVGEAPQFAPLRRGHRVRPKPRHAGCAASPAAGRGEQPGLGGTVSTGQTGPATTRLVIPREPPGARGDRAEQDEADAQACTAPHATAQLREIWLASGSPSYGVRHLPKCAH